MFTFKLTATTAIYTLSLHDALPICPILFPTMDAIVLVPIASHTLTNRPIVLPATQRIEVTLMTDQEVMLTIDGQVGIPLRERDTVEIEKAAGRVRLVRFPRTDFFSVLRTKLKWGER